MIYKTPSVIAQDDRAKLRRIGHEPRALSIGLERLGMRLQPPYDFILGMLLCDLPREPSADQQRHDDTECE